MTNDTTVLALQATPVPSDQECVRNLSEIVQGVAQYVIITGLSSATGGAPGVVPNNNIAQEALALATKVQTDLAALSARVPHYRSSPTPIALVAGDQIVPVTFTDIGTTDYVVTVTMFGTSTFATTFYGWVIVDASRTSNSFQIRFDNVQGGGASFTWVLQTTG